VVRETLKGMVRNFTQYKAEWEGSPLSLVNPKNTSKRCCYCRFVNKKLKDEEEFVCPQCRLRMDRDVNASLNIALLGSGKPALVTPPLIVTGRNATVGGCCLKPPVLDRW